MVSILNVDEINNLDKCVEALENLGMAILDIVPFTIENILELQTTDMVVDILSIPVVDLRPTIVNVNRIELFYNNHTNELSIRAITTTFGEVLKNEEYGNNYINEDFSTEEGFITLFTSALFQKPEDIVTNYCQNKRIIKVTEMDSIQLGENRNPISINNKVKSYLQNQIKNTLVQF